MKTFIGIDVSLQTSAICALDERGKVLKEAEVASDPAAFVAFIRHLPWDISAIGLEAGLLSQWLRRGMADGGIEAVLMETRQVKAVLKAMPVKTDRRDAEGIARLLQMGWFRPVHCKSVSAQEMRALLIVRKAVQQALLDIELSLRGVPRNFGLKLGPISKGRYEERVRELVADNVMLEAAAAAVLQARASLRGELAAIDRRLRDLARQDDAPPEPFDIVVHRPVGVDCLVSFEGRQTAELMVFTLVRAASKKWRKLNGANQLPRVIEGVKFADGVAQPDATETRAA